MALLENINILKTNLTHISR